MRFKITRHRGHRGVPDGALELLWDQLGSKLEDVAFARRGARIVATWDPDARPRDPGERSELGRLRVLEVLTDVCARAPELDLGWYAISPLE